MHEAITINPSLIIPWDELSISYAKSGGPGGQNVNKVNSKVILRWHIAQNLQLGEEKRQKIENFCRSYLTNEGDFLLESTKGRSQNQNLQDCIDKLQKLLIKALTPQKKRRPTTIPKSARETRLAEKKHLSRKKKLRLSDNEE